MKKLSLILSFLFIALVNAMALSFTVNGIVYSERGDAPGTVEIIPNVSTPYAGNITIPATVIYNGVQYPVKGIAAGAFKGCAGLTSVVFTDGELNYLGTEAFAGCTGLKSIILPSSVNFVSGVVFGDCSSLESCVLSNNMDKLSWQTFHNCVALKSITIPAGSASIEWATFDGCTNLNTITDLAVTPQAVNWSEFTGVSVASVKLIVPQGALGAYKAANVWKEFGVIEEVPTGMKQIVVRQLLINGNSGKLCVKHSSSIGHIKVYTVDGKLMYTDFLKTNEVEIAIPKGIYMVKIEHVGTQKIVVK